MKQVEPHDHHIFYEREAERDKAEQKHYEEQEECPHDELDHGICLDCGKDCHEDLEAKADWLRERDV